MRGFGGCGKSNSSIDNAGKSAHWCIPLYEPADFTSDPCCVHYHPIGAIAPLMKLASAGEMLTTITANLKPVKDFLATPEQKRPDAKVEFDGSAYSFENVSFSYNDTKEVLHGISFQTKPGTMTLSLGHPALANQDCQADGWILGCDFRYRSLWWKGHKRHSIRSADAGNQLCGAG